jgi:hypothetical protein
LAEQSVIKLDTPLLNTQLYRRFLDSGKEPIVLKTMAFYDGFTGEYQKFQLGKFGNQVGMHRFTYGLTTSGVFPTSKMGDDYYNSLVGYRPSVVVEYCYYDGNNWIEETETIGGNDESWYTSYTDTLGNKILQHKFDYPIPLLAYTKPYVLSLPFGTLCGKTAAYIAAEVAWYALEFARVTNNIFMPTAVYTTIFNELLGWLISKESAFWHQIAGIFTQSGGADAWLIVAFQWYLEMYMGWKTKWWWE